ncbi:hypothetical protein [Streptomyces sp. NPDC059787]|uniref:hypothetical protein n=1 Tax=Streptomyces sp. NPDC059787 TaxID=3346947 RepID=UPI003647542A
MSNIFSGGSHGLDLSNGATAVFTDVLVPAVSDLVSEGWDSRFAALLPLQDQNVMGRGAVGFDLAEFDRSAAERERARAKDLVPRATALPASGHRWSELGCHPPRVHEIGLSKAEQRRNWWRAGFLTLVFAGGAVAVGLAEPTSDRWWWVSSFGIV